MNLDFITAIRQNHALEHATIALLAKQAETGVRLIGRATGSGFYIYGNVSTEAVEEAAAEGLTRLQKGEGELAVSPFCGTNLVVAGTLAGILSMITLGRKNRLQRLPQVILATIGAVVIAQPVGRLVQRYLTTSASLDRVRITGITRRGRGRLTFHKIETTR